MKYNIQRTFDKKNWNFVTGRVKNKKGVVHICQKQNVIEMIWFLHVIFSWNDLMNCVWIKTSPWRLYAKWPFLGIFKSAQKFLPCCVLDFFRFLLPMKLFLLWWRIKKLEFFSVIGLFFRANPVVPRGPYGRSGPLRPKEREGGLWQKIWRKVVIL